MRKAEEYGLILTKQLMTLHIIFFYLKAYYLHLYSLVVIVLLTISTLSGITYCSTLLLPADKNVEIINNRMGYD